MSGPALTSQEDIKSAYQALSRNGDGVAVRSCQTKLAAVEAKSITTIEGLSEAGDHPLQRAWAKLSVPQCCYCQSGQLMSAAALLASNPDPSDDDIIEAMNGNLCRCGTYLRIRRAIRLAVTSK